MGLLTRLAAGTVELGPDLTVGSAGWAGNLPDWAAGAGAGRAAGVPVEGGGWRVDAGTALAALGARSPLGLGASAIAGGTGAEA